MQVRPGNIRVKRQYGGRICMTSVCMHQRRPIPVCGAEPVEVSAFAVSGADRRFKEVDEMTGALLRFPNNRLASFVCSFGATDVSAYEVDGYEGPSSPRSRLRICR